MNASTAPAPRRLRTWWIAAALLLATVALADGAGWNWTLPLMRHYVMSHSGRRFDAREVHLHLSRTLDPTIELRDVTVENAPWASTRDPLIKAGRIAMTFDGTTLLSDLKVVDLIELEDAQVDMERQADGLRNWRLSDPDDRGPPHLRVAAVRAQRSRLHTIHRGIGLEVDARIAALADARTMPGRPELPLTQHLVAHGNYQGRAFDVDTAVSDVLTFGVTSQMFALDGAARAGGLTLQASGVTTNLVALGDLDVDVALSLSGGEGGTSWPLPQALAKVSSLKAQAHVQKLGVSWTARKLEVQLGRRSRLAGDASFTGAPHSDVRKAFRVVVSDASIDAADIDSMRGSSRRDGAAAIADGTHGLSPRAFDTERLRDIDADVDLRHVRLAGVERDLARSLQLHASLQHGVLRLQSFDLDLAGGRISGTAQLDATQAPSEWTADLEARGLPLAKLSPALARNDSLQAIVDGRLRLQSRGDSARALATAADGSLDASFAPGASISRRLDAKLSLDGGEWLRSLFDKSQDRVPVQCARLTLAIAHGVAVSRRLAFETEHTRLVGHGSLALADASVDATVMPLRKQHALLALDKAIHAAGRPGAIKVSLVPALPDDDAARGVGCGAPSPASADEDAAPVTRVSPRPATLVGVPPANRLRRANERRP